MARYRKAFLDVTFDKLGNIDDLIEVRRPGFIRKKKRSKGGRKITTTSRTNFANFLRRGRRMFGKGFAK